MRRYELMLLLRPDLEDDRLQSAVEKVTRAIVNGGGALTKVSPWGKRRMAYPIQNHREASYFLIHFDIDPAAVRGIERGLLISEDVLRHLVVVIDHDVPDRREEAAVPAAAHADADGEEPVGESGETPSAEAAAGDLPSQPATGVQTEPGPEEVAATSGATQEEQRP
ncbi:MAG TPA: 30S ribosomal protein S6 [Candidatus Limnocylindria bacterium]|nr:30S ribosomal protein S6 [Candidatus Limnocylindria bacterium]